MQHVEGSSNEIWLSQPPKYTTFRVNKLKKFDLKNLVNFLSAQSKELNCSQLPKFYFLRPDCLVVEQWPPYLIPDKLKCEHEVVVDALCAAAVLRGAHVFAPGVMGLSPDCKVGEKVDIYGDLEGHCKRGLKIKYTGKKVYVGTGILKMSRYELYDNGIQPRGIAVHTLLPASRLPVVNESISPKGEILLQNLPSIVCGWVVDAEPNDFILDMCAAPGNKTTHLAEMSNNQAKIIAIDKTKLKTDKIRINCELQAITCVKIYFYDSTKICSNTRGLNGEPPFQPKTFDKVLLDAPCSGLGQRPQLNNKMTPKMLQSYKFMQRKLFEAAAKVLKVHGKLVYSTCTVTVDENEALVAWALKKFPFMKLIPAEPLLGGPGLANCGLTDDQRLLVQRFGPEDDPLRQVDAIFKDTIGFFIAAFTKIQ
ncbi:tRNA (cytosine(72)-C(5))-methyltransferase NSUN6 [Pectinophora gossypiella]|uniref:tRNA (cytosine(72)-C(5))-methyltransferase NSUN6 n=1 Tax=Pectinophora gossypiella TaxID=13191 RepID=UPI00214EC305|nr:tRNA (cytosine(72)-C(5))-methyltransferase NSUN6 [Pectinophora gossypiella]